MQNFNTYINIKFKYCFQFGCIVGAGSFLALVPNMCAHQLGMPGDFLMKKAVE